MVTKLRLLRGESDQAPGAQEEARTLRFPVEAASAMPAPARLPRGGSAVLGRVRPSIRKGPSPSDSDANLVRRIEETLDRVQARFDDLKQQLGAEPRCPRLSFPRRDDDAPRPAA